MNMHKSTSNLILINQLNWSTHIERDQLQTRKCTQPYRMHPQANKLISIPLWTNRNAPHSILKKRKKKKKRQKKKERLSAHSEYKYRFFSTLGSAAEGPEKKDSDGSGEENTSGRLETSRVVGGGENRGNWRREFDGSLFRRCIDGALDCNGGLFWNLGNR